jgi:AmmeMemoRadiSam system protein B
LRRRDPPHRIVILGTNHFGRSTAVVATGKDFETPLGRTATDTAFIERLELRCGVGCGDLRRHEFDHVREHSVELQVLWCQHLFGAERFKIVPILCPDPCGPTGTRPPDGQGVDLGEFAEALGRCIREDDADTLVVAGADLSHVGANFGDDRPFDEEFLRGVWERDKRVLQALEQDGAEAFRACVAEDENPTRVCSAGCIFALKAALPDAKARILRYHQAVDQASQSGVTCAAVAVVE